MSEAKHTPGPWEYVPTGYAQLIDEDDGYRGVRAGEDHSENGFHIAAYMSEADARLIAAAPDLLDVLKLILPLAKGYAHEHAVGSNQRHVEIAQAAIAKAEGRS